MDKASKDNSRNWFLIYRILVAYSAYIPLLEVLPEYQGQGIGQTLVTRIKEDLQQFYMIDICCDDNVVPFYEGQGFKRGHSVMTRNYQQQSGIL